MYINGKAMICALVLCLLAATVLAACGGVSGAYCDKRKECCADLGSCDTYNKEGAVERCVLELDASLKKLTTFTSEYCSTMKSKLEEYYSCYAAKNCAELKGGGCKTEYDAYSSAAQQAGNACN